MRLSATPTPVELANDVPTLVAVDVNGTALLVAATEITQQQFEHIMGYNPSQLGTTSTQPVNSISWEEAALFANRLSEAEGLPICYDLSDCERDTTRRRQRGQFSCGAPVAPANPDCDGFRLPTYAEFVAYSPWTLADAPRREQATQVFAGQQPRAGNVPRNVGSREPNEVGLYDTYGNVGEWLNNTADSRRSDNARCVAGVCYRTPYSEIGPDNHVHIDAGANRSCIGFRVVRRTP